MLETYTACVVAATTLHVLGRLSAYLVDKSYYQLQLNLVKELMPISVVVIILQILTHASLIYFLSWWWIGLVISAEVLASVQHKKEDEV